MTIPLSLLQSLQQNEPQKAWADVVSTAWDICSQPFFGASASSEVTKRDKSLADLDLFLATAGWDLWEQFENSAEKTSTALQSWWSERPTGKAVLVLDALSLRESPWLLEGVKQRGYQLHTSVARAAELPADTTPFAKALGFGQRSTLSNNGGKNSSTFPNARTETTDIPWEDCAALIGSETDWFFWHHWPDNRLHDHDDPGKGLNTLTEEVQQHLTSDAFWGFVERLTEGRRLIITGDHGYAASGIFPDSSKEQTDYLKKKFKSGRCTSSDLEAGDWAPPIDLYVESNQGPHLFVLGRRKWRSQGGYPTLTHGGLSILEVLVPFIEISRVS